MPAQFQADVVRSNRSRRPKIALSTAAIPQVNAPAAMASIEVFANHIVSVGVNCVVMEVQPKNIVRLACNYDWDEMRAQEHDKPWFEDNKFWIDDLGRLNVALMQQLHTDQVEWKK